MALPKKREGESAGFQIHPFSSGGATLGDPEKIIWSSICYLCANDIVDAVLYSVYGINNKGTRTKIANNIKLYITQAYDFYEAASVSKSNTAPLFYYYSFLNLAKATCEIRNPSFHKMPESYKHGLSWKPSKNYLVNMETESVNVSTRGVWHVLLECLLGRSITLQNPLKLSIKYLFALCEETAIEYERTFHMPTQLMDLYEPEIVVNSDRKEAWLRFEVLKEELKTLRLSRQKFLESISDGRNMYRQVQSSDSDMWAFELEQTKKFKSKDKFKPFEFFETEVKAMNLFVHLCCDELDYSIPIQSKLPTRMPQIIVIYTLLFWLGSIVRYDPHSVANLQDSKYWILIDGFMNQSRIWLLELFEWQLYKTETTLKYVR